MDTTLTAGQEITVYSAIRGPETLVIHSIDTVVTWSYKGSPYTHQSLYSVLVDATNPALVLAGNSVEMRRFF